jgi:hypothetical protein
MSRLNRWYEGLSNWRHVAVTASVLIVASAIGGCVIRLTTGHLDVSFIIGYTLVFTVMFTSLTAWTRWK